MAHRAAHDAAEHVAPALVRRQHAIGHQEAAGAQVIGDNAVRGRHRPLRIGLRHLGGLADQRLEKVDFVIVVRSLQHGCDALQPHAGVDRRTRKVAHDLARLLFILHEHEVPDLDEAVAVLVRASGRAAGDMVAMVEEYLRTRPARAIVAHRPEIVLGGDADDAAVGQAGDLLPQREGVVIGMVHRHRQPLGRDAPFLRDEVPREADRAFLEIVAEREISQHFEERMVPRRIADIIEIVVLAAGAHALLAGHGRRVRARFEAGEHVLERHHAGVHEHQRRIVLRHQRRRRHAHMLLAREKVEK